MSQPTYCQVFEAVGDFSAIARGTALDCRIMLEAGYRVSVVSKFIDPELKKEVEWFPLYVPERIFALQWLTARHYLLQAMGNRPYDVIHGHQAQMSDCCDLFQCHFLTRAAANRGVLADWKGKSALTRIQQEVVLRAEDRFYRRLARLKTRSYGIQKGLKAPRVSFISELLRREFHQLYGVPLHDEVLVKAPTALHFPTDEERRLARQQWAPRVGNRLVVGFLGGTHPHKGFRRVLDAMKNEPELFLLFGGPDTEDFKPLGLEDRVENVGFVRDTPTFFAACDVFVVASHFEPLGMVALEAAANGVPVLSTSGVGALWSLEHFGAGLRWGDGEPLGEVARQADRQRGALQEGAMRLCREAGAKAYGEQLVASCETIQREKTLN